MHTSEEMKGLFLRQSLCDLLMDVEESEERGRFKEVSRDFLHGLVVRTSTQLIASLIYANPFTMTTL